MKKASILLLAILLSFALFGCGESNATRPDFTVKDGAYSCTPQEVIAYLNAGVEGDDELLPIPDFVASKERLMISNTPQFSYITFTTNEAGMITMIDLYFANPIFDADPKVLTTVGYHMGVLLTEMMSEEDVSAFSDEISYAISQTYALHKQTYNQTSANVMSKDSVCLIQLKATD